MAKSDLLRAAKKLKQDEFYTQLTDIEKELKHYKKHFKNKIVFCNCDDPFESNFFKYFVLNFNKLGLSKLIATSYVSSPIAGSELKYHIEKNGQMSFVYDSNDIASDKKPYKAIITTVYDKSGNDAVEMLDIAKLFESGENKLIELDGNGDFRSDECIELLKESDIVVTNPPFSLFREYVAQLVEYDKKFIIIGNINAIAYKDFFPLLKENKVWIGVSIHSGDRAFYVPDDYPLNASGCGIDDEGRHFIRVKGVRWFTNLDIKQRHEELVLVKRYNPKNYFNYYNYDAINVDKISDIPCDYEGIIGIPVTFMDKYNPDQFELIGLGNEVPKTKEHMSIDGKEIVYKQNGKIVWSTPYTVSERKLGNSLRIDENGKPGKTPYNRILIRNKHPEQPKGDNK